ncbi:MAG: four helix bundle protein [Muribaculaceae bacterium]|nr:four helix bundle protein [Muribaculaceae bacterium]
MASSILEDKSFELAVRIVKLTQHLNSQKNEYVLAKQVLRSGTSIGANIAEAKGAQSQADFIAKLHISLKEAKEIIYWIKLLHATGYLTQAEYDSLLSDLQRLLRILVSSIKKVKSQSNQSGSAS